MNWDKNFKIIKRIKEKKRKLSKFSSFWFCPILKIEISESFLLLQILTVDVTFSKLVFSRERVKPCFSVTFKISHVFTKKCHWSSSCSEDMEIFSFNINIFINFLGFLTFSCYKKINGISILQMMSALFLTFNLL